VNGTSADKKVTIPPTATTPTDETCGSKPAVSNVAATFAAQVAKAAGEGRSSPMPIPSSSKEEEEHEVEPMNEVTVEVKEEKVEAMEEVQEEIVPECNVSMKESLCVSTELGNREDPLYEPVSPTPLPDSPCDEAKSGDMEQEKVTKPSPFEEVINIKAGITGIDRVEDVESNKVTSKKPKKQSAAAKKAEMNRKGPKGLDLLDVFTQDASPKVIEELKVVKKSPTPEAAQETDKVVKMEKEVVVKENIVAHIEAQKNATEVEVKVVEEVKEEEPEAVVDVPVVEVKVETPVVAPKQNGIPSLLDNIPMDLRRNDFVRSDSRPDRTDVRLDTKADEEQEEPKEEGEITDNDEENENPEGKAPKLKYDYKEDQWSPLNPEGKKQYDREFLICLQRDPLSLTKPNNLPAMEIVKDKPNQMGKPQSGPRIDFTPGFVVRTSSQRGGPRGGDGPRGASRDGGRRDGGNRQGGGGGGGGRDGPNKPRMVISLPSISQEVKLNKAENAWKPTVKDPKAEVDELDVLKKNVLAILNKLTPQKFDTLVEKFTALPIDSQTKLQACMELIFEKAVDEPGFSVAYAKMCQVLQMKKVLTDDSETETVNFRKLLISRCQKEFEKDYMENLDRDQYTKDMNAATTEDDRKQIKAVFEQMEMKLRRRSLGNIRFIGELYKLQMLTARIMHECVKKLLKTTDEESLECLCRLLTTVGQDLDTETQGRLAKGPINGLNELTVYFNEMKRITQDKKVCSRVRFLMQDVIELRLAGWRKRREEGGPKTIDQIHADIEKEQLNAKLQAFAPSGPMPPRRDDNRPRMDDRRRSQKGPDRGPGGGHSGEDGWQAVPSRPAKGHFEKIDPVRLKSMSINSSKVDADSMSFGPPKSGGGGGWGRGSQSKGPSRTEDSTKVQNRFMGLDGGDQSAPQGYDGRGSGGRFGRSGPGAYGGRNSRGGSIEQDRINDRRTVDDKSKAQQTVRDFMTSRSQSVMGPHPTLSRENSAPRSASMVAPPKKVTPSVPLTGDPNASVQQVEKLAGPLLEEYLHIKDIDATLKEIAEKFATNTITAFVEAVLNSVIEKNEKSRASTGTLLNILVVKGLLADTQFMTALDSMLMFAEDLLVDIPKFWDFIAQILAPMLHPVGALPLSAIKDSAVTAKLVEGSLGSKCAGGKYAAAILHEMGKKGHSTVAAAWKESGLTWAEFLPSATEVDQFVADNKLEWTVTEAAKATSGKDMSKDKMALELARVLRESDAIKTNEPVFDWLDATIGNAEVQTPEMIRFLTTAVAESVIDGIGGPTNQCQLNIEKLNLRSAVFKKFVDNKPRLELQVLLALQHVMHRLEHPNKLLHSIFERLYDEDIISEEGFQSWEKNSDPAEQEGKGVALKSCTQFFTWLNEAEEEEDEN